MFLPQNNRRIHWGCYAENSRQTNGCAKENAANAIVGMDEMINFKSDLGRLPGWQLGGQNVIVR